nr:hypothetical protein [Cupriavidus gilardii]
MPKGLYLTVPTTHISTGNVVALCIPKGRDADLYKARSYLPESGRCESGIAPVLKPVAATAGDDVRVVAGRVLINGRAIPNGEIASMDSAGRAIPHLRDGWTRVLADGEAFVMATYSARSLDSRYYGHIPTSLIVARAYPLLTTR